MSVKEIMTSLVRLVFQVPNNKGEGLYPPKKWPKTDAKGFILLT